MKLIRNKGKNLNVTYDGIDYEIPGDGDIVEGDLVLGVGVVTEVPDDVAVHISRTYAHMGCQIVHQVAEAKEAEAAEAAATAAARPPRRHKSDKPKPEPKLKSTAKRATGSPGAKKAAKKAVRKKK